MITTKRSHKHVTSLFVNNINVDLFKSIKFAAHMQDLEFGTH